MKQLKSFFPHFCLCIIVGSSSFGATSESIGADHGINGKVRIGFELELAAPSLSGLMRFYDFEKLRIKLSDVTVEKDFWDEFLHDSPSAYWDLTPELRQELDPKNQIKRNLVQTNSSSLKIDQTSARTQDTFMLDQRVVWETALLNWRRLTFERKQAAILNWEQLSNFKKAQLFILGMGQNLRHADFLKSDLPPHLFDFLNQFQVLKDGDTAEYKYFDNQPQFSFQKVFKDVIFLARLADPRLLRKFLEPEKHLPRDPDLKAQSSLASLHFHYSVQKGNLTEISMLLKKWILLKRLSLGIISDLIHPENYSRNPKSRTLARLLSEFRLETREHPVSIQVELEKMERWLQMPLSETQTEIEVEVQELLRRPDVQSLLLKYPNFEILRDLQIHISDREFMSRLLEPEATFLKTSAILQSHSLFLKLMMERASTDPQSASRLLKIILSDPQNDTWSDLRKKLSSSFQLRKVVLDQLTRSSHEVSLFIHFPWDFNSPQELAILKNLKSSSWSTDAHKELYHKILETRSVHHLEWLEKWDSAWGSKEFVRDLPVSKFAQLGSDKPGFWIFQGPNASLYSKISLNQNLSSPEMQELRRHLSLSLNSNSERQISLYQFLIHQGPEYQNMVLKRRSDLRPTDDLSFFQKLKGLPSLLKNSSPISSEELHPYQSVKCKDL